MKLVLIIGLLYSVHSLSQDKRVLIVGDSWAQFQFQDGTHEDVFASNGFANIEVLGLLTTELGTRASDWAQPEQLQIIVGELMYNPTIDTVQITLGGNDFLGNWTAGMQEDQVLDLQQQIINDLNTIIEAILLIDTNIEVVLSFYDYPNFVDTIDIFTGKLCREKWEGLGEPSAFEINSASASFESAYLQLSQNNSRVYQVNHLGLMQAYYGFPVDVSHPSPVVAMRDTLGLGIPDCFHLNPESHEYLVQNLFDNYFYHRFDTVFKSGFE